MDNQEKIQEEGGRRKKTPKTYSMPPFLTVSPSPHIRSADSTTTVMLNVLIALCPAFLWGIYVFGIRALVLVLISVVSCIVWEAAAQFLLKRPVTVGDLSAAVTGMLLGMNLPVTAPLWMPVVGGFFAIVIVKQLFGGIGQNFANPAITARIVLLVSFASAMTNFTAPKALDAVTTATPLAVLDRTADISAQVADGSLPGLLQMVIGVRGGCIGETCAAALLIGCCWLLVRRVISPIIPLSYLGTVAVLMLAFSRFNLTFTAYELLSGGLLLGAIFMATDYVTSPITEWGRVIFGVGCGLITAAIRVFANATEGVSFAILLMNLVVPYINTLTRPKAFGEVKAQ
jgi:electron transport complex protein RnfD